MRIPIVVGLSLSAILTSAGTAQQRPPEPYIAEGACPFECCVYGRWTARGELPVYAEPRAGAAVVFHLRPDESFDATGGHVRLERVGRVVARRTYEQAITTEDTLRLAPGDTLYVLDYQGEGYYSVWLDGRVLSAADDWGTRETTDESYAALWMSEPESRWWARVRRDDGREGWLDMYEAEVANADACGHEPVLPTPRTADCAEVRRLLEQVAGAAPTARPDTLWRGSGQVTVAHPGTRYQAVAPAPGVEPGAASLRAAFLAAGWSEDERYSAGDGAAPVGLFRKENTACRWAVRRVGAAHTGYSVICGWDGANAEDLRTRRE